MKKGLLNVRVNVLFYFLFLGVTFFSRKIFLEYLGADFMGLTGTLGNILGYLNLAELGIGTAVSVNLYKPLLQKDHKTISDITSLLGYLYKKIGLLILAAAVVVSLFFPLIFKGAGFGMGVIYFAFFTLLSSSLLGYFLTYKATVVYSDQKGYLILTYIRSAQIMVLVIQTLLLYKTQNIYLYLSINLIFGVISALIINWRVEKLYPWLKSSMKEGKRLVTEYKSIIASTKQLFVHRIAGFILNNTDQLFIFIFESLKMVAYYGNYVMVVTRIGEVFTLFLDSFGAGVGNLVAQGDKNRILKVFWEMMAMRYFTAGFLVFSIYHLINPFISLWLGGEYILSNTILVLILVNMFIMRARGTIDTFIEANKLFKDVWAPMVEGALNIVVTIVFGYFYGLIGILLGKIVSLSVIIVFWKPVYLFKVGFRRRVRVYWRGVVAYYAVFVGSFVLVRWLGGYVTIDPYAGFLQWILYSVIFAGGFAIVYGFAMLVFTNGTRDLLKRLPVVNRFV